MQPKADESVVDFRARVMSLKDAIDDKMRLLDNKKDKTPTPSNDEAKNEEKKATLSEDEGFTENNLGLAPLAPKPPLGPPPIPLGSLVSFGYETVSGTSQDIINISHKLTYYKAGYQFSRRWTLESPMIHIGRISFGKISGKSGVKPYSPYMGAALYEGFQWSKLGIMPYLGLELDTLNFANLPSTGNKLQSANISVYYAGMGLMADMILFSQPMVIYGQYSHVIGANANYSTVSSASEKSGSKMTFGVQFKNVVKFLGIELKYYQTDFSATGGKLPLKTKSTGIGFNGFFTF